MEFELVQPEVAPQYIKGQSSFPTPRIPQWCMQRCRSGRVSRQPDLFRNNLQYSVEQALYCYNKYSTVFVLILLCIIIVAVCTAVHLCHQFLPVHVIMFEYGVSSYLCIVSIYNDMSCYTYTNSPTTLKK